MNVSTHGFWVLIGNRELLEESVTQSKIFFELSARHMFPEPRNARLRIGRTVVEPSPAPWRFEEIAGRLVEVSGAGATAALTVAVGVALEAQRLGEPVAWVTPKESSFYPPDAAESGVDLDALVVIRVPEARDVARAADRLARSGAFGLIVLDVGAAAVPTPLQARLAGLARKHHAALVCLTRKERGAPLARIAHFPPAAGSARRQGGGARRTDASPPPRRRGMA